MEASGVGCVVPKTMAARAWGLFGVQWWLGFGRKKLMGQFEKSNSGGGDRGTEVQGSGWGSAGAARCEPSIPTSPRRLGRAGALSASPSHWRNPGRAEPPPHRPRAPSSGPARAPGSRLRRCRDGHGTADSAVPPRAAPPAPGGRAAGRPPGQVGPGRRGLGGTGLRQQRGGLEGRERRQRGWAIGDGRLWGLSM